MRRECAEGEDGASVGGGLGRVGAGDEALKAEKYVPVNVKEVVPSPTMQPSATETLMQHPPRALAPFVNMHESKVDNRLSGLALSDRANCKKDSNSSGPTMKASGGP